MFSTRNFIAFMIILCACFYFFLHDKPSARTSVLSSPYRETILEKNIGRQEPPHTRPTAEPAKFERPLAEDKSAVRLPAQAEDLELTPKTERWGRYATGLQMTQSEGSFAYLRLRAIPKSLFTKDLGEVIEEKLNLVVFDPAAKASPPPGDSYAVVMKNSNGSLGIISGTLLVTLNDLQQAALLGQRFRLSLKAQDAALSLAYYAAPPTAEIYSVVETLRQDPLVKSVEAEIVQNWKKR